MSDRELTLKEQKQIDWVAATMAIEDMPLTEGHCKELRKIASGAKTVEESIQASIAKYKAGDCNG